MPSVSKTAANASPQTEKPTHYTYLKEFRTEQCPLFLQHKCTQHRPFTCFHWHFLNQRRRRPIRRRDGTFNYSPDVYCTKYDETTGICPDGDDCPYLHRTTGDTERKYHLRYYKTGTCIHETDARGHCVKNGLHCAFAHGPHDLRPPVYDIREIQAQEALQNGQLGSGEGIPDLQPGVLASQAMIEKTLTEDPRWQDTNFVLANYKTDQCTKPPRLCRQGYACPHYHNSRDRRRNPRKFKYRSTPCPNVKHGDEWGEPSKCDSGDSCQYCHSRTEQQFHPEIYKSTKCNDMRQTGYCPRGPFCAFAHVESKSVYPFFCTFLHFLIYFFNSAQLVDFVTGLSRLLLLDAFDHFFFSRAILPILTQNTVFSSVNPLATSFTSSITSSLASSIGSDSSSPTTLSTMNAKATPFYPGSNTVESVIGESTSGRQRTGRADDPPSPSPCLSPCCPEPCLSKINLRTCWRSRSTASWERPPPPPRTPWVSQSSHKTRDRFGFFPTPRLHGCSSFLPGLNGGANNIWDFVSGSFSPSPSPVFSSLTSTTSSADLARLFRELDEAKRKIKQWEEAWHQVKQACEACQKDAHEAKEQAKSAEAERQLAEQKWEETERKLKELQGDFDVLCRTPGTPLLRSYGELDQLPLSKLHSIQSQLRNDLDVIDGVIYQLQSKKCIVCQKHDRCIVLQPCQHYVLCENCAPSKTECPYCRTKILKW
uniref:Unk like zinc finger n=1 Tax=Salarias fasciatus TaxID=181472 RepID=A0A672FCX0_SALFA